MTISPRYDQYKDAWDTEVTVEVCVCVYIMVSNLQHLNTKLLDNIDLLCSFKWDRSLRRFASFTATNEGLIVFL